MDCDLQHPVETLVTMYRKWEEGYEVVEGIKSDRGRENPVYHLMSGIFYSIMSKETHVDMKGASDF